jgi:protein-S-isoprenylcysteine O-methyltransferase Ste14
MLKLAPPIWTLIYLLLCVALSWSLDWPAIPGLPIPPLGMALVALAFIPPVWAFVLFQREDTEISPTSAANRKLVTRGPYRFTRNPMYLAWSLSHWALPYGSAPGRCSSRRSPYLLLSVGSTSTSRRPRCAASSTAYDDYVARVRRWLCKDGTGVFACLPSITSPLYFNQPT